MFVKCPRFKTRSSSSEIHVFLFFFVNYGEVSRLRVVCQLVKTYSFYKAGFFFPAFI